MGSLCWEAGGGGRHQVLSCGWERGRRRCLASGCESIRINSDQAALLFSENSRKLLVDPIHSDRFGSAVRRELEGCLLKDVEWGGGGGGGETPPPRGR